MPRATLKAFDPVGYTTQSVSNVTIKSKASLQAVCLGVQHDATLCRIPHFRRGFVLFH
ncbi:hypothetical protein XAP412_970003 [Xanthomonas phaseoli pv. phaseoli]|uniref:Uncharacterized protein n=1 Tax=Xanthomonas campestris pv. phaseoli TaxID=317013 RepID=A0AB38E6Y9_XANCH|nr:hypothetical protein XAP6984_1000003 [Xanthomonas phaseoli pv. phaseoli]SON91950.1 hypothetical protein XAP412_970003 [Xanthomonas phaseoli pv. phaseoli]SON93199.1 hypothetical protein XAP7430_990003 [Xanthomonas phaseoli pv. phaseoli]SOO30233.1 hypothetical protein XAP6164_4190003 [Xanthomonas phaseoli pv. phaseoli]